MESSGERDDVLREMFPICQNWLFRPGFQSSWVQGECRESEFEKVTLPHTALRVPYSGFDEGLYQGVFCYRRRFRLPERCGGKRVSVDFEGAMTAAKVYLNGRLLGEHCGGYLPFSFDLTDTLRWGEDNVFHAPEPFGTRVEGPGPAGPAFHALWRNPVGTVLGWPSG